jgi:AcrR family transcriptional regulator
MGVVRARRRIRMPAVERREQLLAAATSLIAERGYWALSMQDVADACDLSLTGLLHHFPSKDALLVAVLARHDELEVRALDEDLGVTRLPGLPPESPLVDWNGVDLWTACQALVERNARQPDLVRLYAVLEAESLAPEHPAHGYFAERQENTLAIFRHLAGTREGAEALARKVLALMDGLQLQWLRDSSLDFAETWRRMAADIRPDH